MKSHILRFVYQEYEKNCDRYGLQNVSILWKKDDKSKSKETNGWLYLRMEMLTLPIVFN